MKYSACAGLRPQAAPMRFDDGPAERQPQSHAVLLRAGEGVEYAGAQIRLDAGPRVAHADAHVARPVAVCLDLHVAPLRFGGHDRVVRVRQQIPQDDFDLSGVDEYLLERRVHASRYLYRFGW